LQDIRQGLISLKEDAKGFGKDIFSRFVAGLNNRVPETPLQDLSQDIRDGLVSLKEDAQGFGKDIFSKFVTGLKNRVPETPLQDLLQDIRDGLVSLKEDGKGFGKDIFSKFVTGLKNLVPETPLQDFLQDIRDGLASLKEDAVDFGANVVIGLVRGFAQANVPERILDFIGEKTGVDLSIDDVPAFRDVPTDDTGGTGTGRDEQTGNTPAGPIATTNQIDGQTLSESTGRFRRGPTARNGGI
jgi:uncharacterized protein YbjQ (UPF0145 family)